METSYPGHFSKCLGYEVYKLALGSRLTIDNLPFSLLAMRQVVGTFIFSFNDVFPLFLLLSVSLLLRAFFSFLFLFFEIRVGLCGGDDVCEE